MPSCGNCRRRVEVRTSERLGHSDAAKAGSLVIYNFLRIIAIFLYFFYVRTYIVSCYLMLTCND